MINLTPRLRAVVSLLPADGSVADVGTDHGYIPVYLAQKGGYGPIIASDIRPGPLDAARSSAEEHCVENAIDLRLTDGLHGIGPVDAVIVAGMGGETIISVLAPAPWTKGARLVLQPQSKIGELTRWLCENGYAIADAKLSRDAGKLYLILSATGGDEAAPGGIYALAPRRLAENRDPLLGEYLAEVRKSSLRALNGMRLMRERSEARERELEALIEGADELLEEIKTW